MRPAAVGMVVAIVAPTMVGCTPDALAIELGFPSQETFVRSEVGRVIAIELDSDRHRECPALTMEAALGTLDEPPAAETGELPVCDFREGSATLDALEPGTQAFIAVIRSAAGQPLLTGCTVRDPFVQSDVLHLALTPTEDYRMLFPPGSAPPDCDTADEKCTGACR